jgi:hypothetical protein
LEEIPFAKGKNNRGCVILGKIPFARLKHRGCVIFSMPNNGFLHFG